MKKIMYHLEYILIIPLIIMSFIFASWDNFIYYLIGICFSIMALCYILLLINKSKTKALSGIFMFINGAVFIVILLLLAISKLSNKVFWAFAIYAGIYGIFKIFSFIYYRQFKDLKNTIYKEYSIIMIMIMINLITCMIIYNFDEDESLTYMVEILVKIFVDNYTKYDTLKFYLIVIKLALNFITSIFVAYYSSSSMILLLKNKPLTMKEKIKSVVDFIQKYYLAFIIGEIFTTIIFINYAIKSNDNEQYKYISFFYLIILFLRTLLFIWNLILEKKYKNEKYRLYRKQFILLIITAATFIILNQPLNSALLAISIENNNPNAFPTWWLILIILPFSGYGFLSSFLSYKRARMNDNAYLMAYSNLSFVSSLFMFFGSIVYIIAKLDDTPAVIIWYILITIVILAELIVSIISLVVGIKGVIGKRKKESDFENENGDE